MADLVGQGQQEDVDRPCRDKDPEWQLRKYLVLLAILVATVTYVAGLDPPGGVWLETKGGHRTGNPILLGTRRLRYLIFYYFNATSFAASLLVSILLLFMSGREHGQPADDQRVLAVRGFMVIDVLCLLVAYVAGSCRGHHTTIYASVFCAAIFLFVIVFTAMAKAEVPPPGQEDTSDGNPKIREQRKVLMLLAIFVTTITYTAGLNPPGGFWEHAGAGHHRAGDPILLQHHRERFVAFWLCNTAAFAASLVIVTLLLSRSLWRHNGRLMILYGAIAVALLGIVLSYSFGSARKTKTTQNILCLVVVVVVYIAGAGVIHLLGKSCIWSSSSSSATTNGSDDRKDRSRILLLATLAAIVTYQAGLRPPGGVWHEGGNGHSGGDLILPGTHPRQYQVFFFCNTAAFVTSIIVVMMVQSNGLVRQRALKAAVMLDLLGLVAAYVAGSCRDVGAPMYALGSVFLLVVVILIAVQCRGLSPPGKFWHEERDEAHRVGDPVLADNYPRRYKVFFYSNATSFMVSVAVILMLVGRKLTDANRYCSVLLTTSMYVSLVGLAGLLLAYAAGTTRKVKTSAYVCALFPLVLLIVIIQINYVHQKLEKCYQKMKVCLWGTNHEATNNDPADADRLRSTTAPATTEATHNTAYRMRKYLMLVGILAASVTYQAGLDPPGGVWPRDGNGHAAGDPSLHDSDRRRYHVFFYSNSACFFASVVVVVKLLRDTLHSGDNQRTPTVATHTAVVLDLLGLLVAYATGNSKDWHASGYVLAMAAAVLAYVAIYVLLSACHRIRRARQVAAASPTTSSSDNGEQHV
ncbi:hypothetical protein PR202_ga17143 [Eleusine coracana subsp. coracana]|uniref:PGG domain-containing protein n=1 Tax=Eleusine coracana subsp. coracana TaxID=191504 RepID=A0AAV5CP84_ELECO|nr:hypothetical protein PR202_ga17143 [Eleusine coracana subsp. coracana]